MITITTNMGITDVKEIIKVDLYKTWDRVKVYLTEERGTVLFASGSYTSVVLDNGELYLYLHSEIYKVDEATKPLSFELLNAAKYDFGMLVFDITLLDDSTVKCCYIKEGKFLEVPAPFRQFGIWNVNYVVPNS